MINDLWYKNAVFYCVSVSTFLDTNGDGIGDFQGLMRRLDYLQGLGITALWLMPFQPSPGLDDGYDVADYYGVDPRYGTLGDFVEFTHGCDQRGMRVLIDLVVNHTSDQHQWFQAARQNPKSKYRDWYVWSKKKPKDAEKPGKSEPHCRPTGKLFDEPDTCPPQGRSGPAQNPRLRAQRRQVRSRDGAELHGRMREPGPRSRWTVEDRGSQPELLSVRGRREQRACAAWRRVPLSRRPYRLKADGNTGQKMTLVGWAVDGFPMYARYAYAKAKDPHSGIRALRTSYALKSIPDAGRPPVSIAPMGTFAQDYHYLAGSGDLDECNGRTGVTPELPAGTYFYLITDGYPYVPRCVQGNPSMIDDGPGGGPPGRGPRGGAMGGPPPSQ